MTPPPSRGAASDRTGRIVALCIAASALLLMLWIGRHDVPVLNTAWAALTGAGSQPASTGNPELDACLAQRVGDVDQMREDGVITSAQYDAFKARAEAFCTAQFPPVQ